jgi:hypothetical protein
VTELCRVEWIFECQAVGRSVLEGDYWINAERQPSQVRKDNETVHKAIVKNDLMIIALEQAVTLLIQSHLPLPNVQTVRRLCHCEFEISVLGSEPFIGSDLTTCECAQRLARFPFLAGRFLLSPPHINLGDLNLQYSLWLSRLPGPGPNESR